MPSALSGTPHVVVVGGGIAGLAAATGLVERGVTVDVVERESYLGGRVGGWTEQSDRRHRSADEPRLPRVLPAVLQPACPVASHRFRAGHAHRRSRTTLWSTGRAGATRFRGLPQTPPLNAIAFALRSPTFRLRDLVRINARAAAPLAAVSVPDIYQQLDHLDADSFLRDINFPSAARHLAFEVFSRSFFAEPGALSAAELATMFHIYFLGSSEGLVFDVANANFDVALWNPLREYLESRGAKFHTGVSVNRVTTDPRLRVHCDSGVDFECDGLVLATDVAGLQRIVDASAGLGDDPWRARIAAMGTAPPFVVQRLWLDRPVNADRAPFLGTGGRPPLDNVSVLERYEKEAAQWSRRTGGSVVELHSYAVTSPADDLGDRMLARLHELYPETTEAKIVEERVLTRSDCPRFAPGDHAARPTVATAHPAVMLAGDGIRIDLPVALMERAATTGWSAANRLLAHYGLAGHVLHTVPVQGRSSALRRLAQRERQPAR